LLSVSLRSTAASHIEHLDFLSQGLKLLDDTTLITRWNTEVALIVREFMNAETDPRSHRDRVRVVVDHLDPADTVACQIAMRCARSLTSTNQPHDALPITERFNANCDGVDTEGFPVEIALSPMWLHWVIAMHRTAISPPRPTTLAAATGSSIARCCNGR